MKVEYSKTIEKPCGFQFAKWSAGAKAFEFSLPQDQQVVYDPYALHYSGKDGMKMVAMMNRLSPSIRKAIALRARFMDDYSVKCAYDGVRQIVLLGAGYDSRFLRLKEFRNMRIFELDLESTQTIKKVMTRKLLGYLPPNIVYVPIDFSKDSLTKRLFKYNFNRNLRTLFVWEGVTLFLNHDILAHTLGRLYELGSHNYLTFDFVSRELVENETGHEGNRKLLDLCALIKEPLTFGSSPEEMEKLLLSLGYTNVGITSMRQANRLYGGSENIEDCYYFASADMKKNTGDGKLII
jgi:methyltransferase (TIGR00027 family)